MAHDYTASKRIALKTIIILAVVTVVEVLIALTGKGYIIDGVNIPSWLMNISMITLSLYKAFLIVGEFMHLKHEVKPMALSILLPVLLLVWAIIAFLYEGDAWKGNREVVKEKNEIGSESLDHLQGNLIDKQTKPLH